MSEESIYYYPPVDVTLLGPCEWAEDVDGNWDTGCGNIFCLTDGTPAENDMNYCCYCGKSLTEKKYQYPAYHDEGSE